MNQRLVIDGTLIEDWPQPWTQEPYVVSRKAIVERFQSQSQIEALVEFGTTTFPGISDMDVYILLRDDAKNLLFPGYWVFEGLARETMTHDFFLMRSSYYQNSVHYFDPWIRTHSLLKGDVRHRLPRRPCEGLDDVWLRLSHVHDCLFQVPVITQALKSNRLEVRRLLDIICYAGYCLREVDAASRYLGGQSFKSDFSNRLDVLRKDINDSGDRSQKARQVIDFTRESLRIFAKAFIEFGRLIAPHLIEERSVGSPLLKWLSRHQAEAIILTTQSAVLYKNMDWDEESLVRSWMTEPVRLRMGIGPWGRQLQIPVVTAPAALSGFFSAHLDAHGEFADLVKLSYHTLSRRRRLPGRVLSQRLQLWNDNWVWLRAIRHPRSGGKSPHIDFGFPLDMSWKRKIMARQLRTRWRSVNLINT